MSCPYDSQGNWWKPMTPKGRSYVILWESHRNLAEPMCTQNSGAWSRVYSNRHPLDLMKHPWVYKTCSLCDTISLDLPLGTNTIKSSLLASTNYPENCAFPRGLSRTAAGDPLLQRQIERCATRGADIHCAPSYCVYRHLSLNFLRQIAPRFLPFLPRSIGEAINIRSVRLRFLDMDWKLVPRWICPIRCPKSLAFSHQFIWLVMPCVGIDDQECSDADLKSTSRKTKVLPILDMDSASISHDAD